MSSGYLERLSRLCETLSNFCDRIERRSRMAAACTADAYANVQMLKTLRPARDVMQGHYEFCQQHMDAQERLSQSARDRYFDNIVSVAQIADDLERLVGNQLNRVGHAPGSLQRLTPFFLEVVMQERAQIDRLQTEIRTLNRQDIDLLKTIPRNRGRKRPCLQLVHTAG